MITINEYKEAVKKGGELNIIKDVKNTEFDKSDRAVEDRYYKLERRLNEQKLKERNRISKKYNKFNEKIEKQIKPYSEKISEFKKIIKLIETSKAKVDLNIEMYKYDYPRDEDGDVIRTDTGSYPDKERMFLKPISILKNDEFCNIAVYIYTNKKPTNCYSLCVVGRSIFDSENILSFSWSHLSNIDENGHFKRELKSLSDTESLVKWFNKNKQKIFKEKIKKIEETIKEYKEVIKNTNTKEWEIAYFESRKDYYENHYSHGEETKEYGEVIKKLVDLTTGKEKEKYFKILKDLIVGNLN